MARESLNKLKFEKISLGITFTRTIVTWPRRPVLSITNMSKLNTDGVWCVKPNAKMIDFRTFLEFNKKRVLTFHISFVVFVAYDFKLFVTTIESNKYHLEISFPAKYHIRYFPLRHDPTAATVILLDLNSKPFLMKLTYYWYRPSWKWPKCFYDRNLWIAFTLYELSEFGLFRPKSAL